MVVAPAAIVPNEVVRTSGQWRRGVATRRRMRTVNVAGPLAATTIPRARTSSEETVAIVPARGTPEPAAGPGDVEPGSVEPPSPDPRSPAPSSPSPPASVHGA